MRPYIAIIVDSFRAALASRVLYVLLGLIVLLLLAIAPIHLTESLDWKVQIIQHVPNPTNLVKQLVERGQSDRYPEVQRIWERLSEKTRDSLVTMHQQALENPDTKNEPESGRRGRRRRNDLNQYFPVINEINDIIQNRDFYREEDWVGKSFDPETRNLLEEGVEVLDEEHSRRLNRLLIARALPAIESGAPTTLTLYYGYFTWDELTFSATREQAASIVNSVMTYFLDKIVLLIGLAVGIVVTANIIPTTFDPGSLNLLLSKPITRWGLYLTKFVGGCALIAICSILLFSGLWLWMGLGIGVWDRALLYSIPLYILLFAIYFSISAFFGLTYRSAIMAVIMTSLFWLVCFALGSGFGFFNAKMQNLRIYNPSVTEDQALAFDGVGNLIQWNPKTGDWNRIASGKPSDPDQEMAINVATWFGKLKDQPFQLAPQTDGQGRSYAGVTFILNRANPGHDFFFSPGLGQPFQKMGRFPRDSMASFATEDGLLVVNRQGDFLSLDPDRLSEISLVSLDEDTTESMEPEESSTSEGETSESSPQIPESAVKKRPTSAADVFDNLGPENPVRISNAFSVAYNASNQEVAIHRFKDGVNRVFVYQKRGDRYVQDRSVEFDLGADKRITCYVAYQGNTIMIAAGNGQIITIDAQTMQEKHGYKPETRFPVETIAASPDGRWFALHYGDQRLWLLDAENDDSMNLANITGQRSVCSVSFNRSSELCVVDREDRVICYEPESMTAVKTMSASGDLFQNIFRYAINPMYTVFPRPGEFYKVVTHLSSTKDTKANTGVDLIGTPVDPDPFAPLWSGIGFMGFMLLISCLYFNYKDY